MSELPFSVNMQDPMLLHRFSIKPNHLDAYLELLPQAVSLREEYGFACHRLFLDVHAEPKVTWLYSHPDPTPAETELAVDPRSMALAEAAAPHVFRNTVVRPVGVERLTHATPDSVKGRIAIMRRYSVVGDWGEFLGLWRQILDVREAHGFRCLFAVRDEPKDMFTWAFDFAGDFADFPAAQRDYYRDPARVALRGVFDYMADYTISPAEQLRADGRRFDEKRT
ncbi:MAG: hypothetical protein R2722_03500 [Tessaracoccus sp.]